MTLSCLWVVVRLFCYLLCCISSGSDGFFWKHPFGWSVTLPRRTGTRTESTTTPASKSTISVSLPADPVDGFIANDATLSSSYGIFRPFADHVIQQLNATGWVQPLSTMDEDLKYNIGALPSLYRTDAMKNAEMLARGCPHNHDKVKGVNKVFTNALSIVDVNDYQVHISVVAMEGHSENTFHPSPIHYARIVLIETLPKSNNSCSPDVSDTSPVLFAHGLHALNILIFPNNSHPSNKSLPVWGVSMATAPGTRLPTMITIDAQPMNNNTTSNTTTVHTQRWKQWHNAHVASNPNLPWGGPLRPQVQPYMSEYLLWSKLPSLPKTKKETPTVSSWRTNETHKATPSLLVSLSSYNGTNITSADSASSAAALSSSVVPTETSTTSTMEDTLSDTYKQRHPPSIIPTIQHDVWDAYREHLEIYLQLLKEHSTNKTLSTNNRMRSVPNQSASSAEPTVAAETTASASSAAEYYCDYWRYNEPERSTMQSLFGKEWTERLLWQVMFPFTSSSSTTTTATTTTTRTSILNHTATGENKYGS